MECLLSFENANVDHPDINNRTSLSHAAEAGRYDIMELLINSGADLMHSNEDGHTCFWFLLRNRQLDSSRPIYLHALLLNPDSRDPKGRTLLSWAAEYGDKAMVVALLRKGADPNLQDNSTTDTFCKTPIIWALENKHWSAVSVLSKKDTNSLHLIIEKSRSIGERETLELVQGLVDSKYNIEQTNAEGKCPLHLASELSNADLVRVLVSAEPALKPSLDARDNSSKTPLQYAFESRNEGAIQVLLKDGVDIGSIESDCCFKLRAEPRLCVELTRQSTRQSYVFKQTAVQNISHWVPRAGEYRLWCV